MITIDVLRPLAQKLMVSEIEESIKQFLDEMSMGEPDYSDLPPSTIHKLESAYYEYLAVCSKIEKLQEEIIYECF